MKVRAGLAIAFALALAPLPSRATVAIVAGPGSYAVTYTTPVMVWSHDGGTTLQFVNADLQAHDVVSDETRAPGSNQWCPAGGGRCPLFFSDEIGIARVTEVKGLADVAPGVYTFYCSPHSWMVGALVVT